MIISPERTISQIPVNDDQLINHINSRSNAFKAEASSYFKDWTLAHVKNLGGISITAGAQRVPVCAVSSDIKVPTEFDARNKWSACFEGKEVYEGGNCTSSWATSAASVVTNRFCIADPVNLKDLVLSPQVLLSCDQGNRGCDGGDLDTVWDFITQQGLVTETCMPWKASGELGCESKCANEVPLKIASHCLVHGEEGIMREILVNGPVVAPVFVHDDFLVYRSGVYRTLPTASRITDRNRMMVIHAIKLIGWGVDRSQGPYWLVENSWGSSWGEHGFAKIARGKESILIDNLVMAATPAYQAVQSDDDIDSRAAEESFDDLDDDEGK